MFPTITKTTFYIMRKVSYRNWNKYLYYTKDKNATLYVPKYYCMYNYGSLRQRKHVLDTVCCVDI